jgi:TM2 domain-containing membrane protein YozV
MVKWNFRCAVASMAARARPFALSQQQPTEQRSVAISYLLWALCCFGFCGIHRIYNRQPISGIVWFFTLGFCGIGQLVDLLLIPSMVARANQSLLKEPAVPVPVPVPSIEYQLLHLARRRGQTGFTINDALLELRLPNDADSDTIRSEIERLMFAELLDVGNDERGRVIYREP